MDPKLTNRTVQVLVGALIALEGVNVIDTIWGRNVYDVPDAFLQGVFALLMALAVKGTWNKITNGRGKDK